MERMAVLKFNVLTYTIGLFYSPATYPLSDDIGIFVDSTIQHLWKCLWKNFIPTDNDLRRASILYCPFVKHFPKSNPE